MFQVSSSETVPQLTYSIPASLRVRFAYTILIRVSLFLLRRPVFVLSFNGALLRHLPRDNQGTVDAGSATADAIGPTVPEAAAADTGAVSHALLAGVEAVALAGESWCDAGRRVDARTLVACDPRSRLV